MDNFSTITSSAGPSFLEGLRTHRLLPLQRAPLSELQVNMGKLCNQACEHCHVEAGPKRTEIMSPGVQEKILSWTEEHAIARVDITGGAPELVPGFRTFVQTLRRRNVSVTARCNLTVLLEPGQEDLAQWYAQQQVRLVCSLPCYSEGNVDQQRGKGVFAKSIQALKRLNRMGYGQRDDLVLDLVYNPVGASLPPEQSGLEASYKNQLGQDHGIVFNRLLTLTNLPINRFAHYLRRTNQLESYFSLLEEHFNPDAVPGLMCRHLLSVDWLGRTYDCDFNQMLELPLGEGSGVTYLWELDASELEGAPIAVDRHCYGCTAGAGSSCGGALT